MECRTNELFKSYLQEAVITKTPSPRPQIPKYKEMLNKQEKMVLNQSVSRLCAMMEKCEIQFKNSNNMIQSLFSADSDFILVQKNELKSIMSEFHKEFDDFKSEMKSDMSYLKSQVTQNQQVVKSHSQNTFNSRKPLTPPCSFEEILKGRNLDSLSQTNETQNAFHTIKQEQKHHGNNNIYNSSPQKSKFNYGMSPMKSTISYKIEKSTKQKRKKRPPETRIKSPVDTIKSSLNNKTQSWINSLPMNPPQESPCWNMKFKKIKDPESDNESVGGWSCRSVRTIKSRKRIRALRPDRDREVKSEIGFTNIYTSPGYHPRLRSEY